MIDHLSGRASLAGRAPINADDDADFQLALWLSYEIAYRGLAGVDDRLEWDPDLLRVRRTLEDEFEASLRERCAQPPTDDVTSALFALVEADDGPSLAHFVQRRGTREQVLRLLRLRSLYHLKEADPTSWTVPRVTGRTQAALVELQYDEYGGGDPRRVHRSLFARGLEDSGLSADPGHYVDEATPTVLAQNNAMSLFGLHRRLRGASLGHLAAFEATSSVPSRRMARGLQRLGFPESMTAYYLEHVEADAVHEQLAVREICQPLVDAHPELSDDVLWGAAVCLQLEADFATDLLREWNDD